MKVALVYDRVNKFGGAERVLMALHELYPQAPLYTSVYNPKKTPWTNGWTVKPSFLQAVPLAKNHHEWFVMLMPHAFESFDFSEFDLVISVTSAEAKGIIVKPPTLHVCYLLTPTRYLWSHTHQYRGHGLIGGLRLIAMSKLRRWDFIAAQRPDALVAISQSVAQRCRKYYRREPSAVIYPPVDIDRFKSHPPKCYIAERGYYLVVSRLVGYKNIDTVIRAFKELSEEQLLIAGTGEKLDQYHRLAPGNVTFLGAVSEAKLVCLYHHARALIFPQEEDFGLVAVEALAAGCPVVAYNRGAIREIVLPGESGIVYDKNTAAGLIQALGQAKSMTWDKPKITQSAQKFTDSKFKQSFQQFVEDLCQKHPPALP